ncbi:sensor histidine kinase [Spongiimicrobium sp. 2-473A-2-J]|uniref:sensor histidine kinase n=1 Tax=Eudoraea algarum TaxID=3417568 RepID=UPI003D36D630
MAKRMANRQKKVNLLKRTSRKYLISAVVLMLVSLVPLYFVTQHFIRDETDDSLKSTLYRIEKLLGEGQPVKSIHPIIEVQETELTGGITLKDTLIYDPLESEMERFRQLSAYKKANGKMYQISVRILLVESEDIVLAILTAFLGIILIIFLAQYYFTRQHTKTIWMPFFENLHRIKTFSLLSGKKIELIETDILEFSELNNELYTLTEKVALDYKNLKQFTEDVSHEIQNPLAIMQAIIGTIIDDNAVNDQQFQQLTELQQNVQRLARLNKKLVLLAKIGNQQFASSGTLNIVEVLQQSIEDHQEMGSVSINMEAADPVEVHMDPTLARILTDNLLSNAVKYTPEDGQIFVNVTNTSFTVSNTGDQPIAAPEKLYDRFYREDNTKKSLGLGLAIVKKICDSYGLKIQYAFKAQYHQFSVYFPQH